MSKVHYSTIWMVESNVERTTIALNSKPGDLSITEAGMVVGWALGRSRYDLIVELGTQSKWFKSIYSPKQ